MTTRITLGKYIISGSNIGAVTMLYGGIAPLANMPSTRPPDSTDWGDSDGIDVDLLTPLNIEDTRVTIPLIVQADEFSAWNSYIFGDHTHGLTIGSETFTLRPCALKVTDETYTHVVCDLEAIIAPPMLEHTELDLRDVGCSILEHSFTHALTPPPVKLGKALARVTNGGSRYLDGGRPIYASHEIEIHLIGSYPTLAQLFAQRARLLGMLTAPGVRRLDVGGRVIVGYYTSCNTEGVYLSGGGVQWVFTIILRTT